MKPKPLLALVALLVTPALPAAAQGDMPMPAWPKAYSADVVFQGAGMPGKMKARYVLDGENLRIEMNQGAPQEMIMINNADKKTSYMVMPQAKQYIESPISQNPMPAITKNFTSEEAIAAAKPEYQGQEEVNGVTTNKYSVSTDQGTMLIWISAADNHPVRIASQDGSIQVDWTNFKSGPQPASDFLPPAGYKAMKLPGGMMPGGGMPAGLPGI